MKTVTLLTIVSVLVGTSGFLIKFPTFPVTTPSISAPVGWVYLQKQILPLFENVCEDSSNPIIVTLAQEFNLDSSSGIYLKPEVIENLRTLKSTKGLLAKGEILREYNDDHMNELRIIYEVLFYAKDFDTFYKAASWARQNVNCGLFVDAIYLAILNRRDTEKLSVPAPYELLPNYFINKDVIRIASTLLAGDAITPSEDIRDEGNAYMVNANYTANFYDDDNESKLAYFNEDIGLNCFYFFHKLKRAPWFNTPPDSSIEYGEQLYHMMRQLTTRYDLERYSNGLPEVEIINWDTCTIIPYDPMLIYSNGIDFGHRTLHEPTVNSDIEFLQNIEANIESVVNHMRDIGYNKAQILNHLMEVLITGLKSYETIARRMIGKNMSENGQPTVLAHYMTTLRDPMFWKLNKKIVSLVNSALMNLPGYAKEEVIFPGIEIINIEVKKMMTMFDYFQFDVTDALKSASSNITFQVKIGQPRLNHKPFALKLNVSSLVSQKGLVKIYLGPKVAPGEYDSKKNLFMLLDSFEYNFKMGYNLISRTSNEITNISEDFQLLRALRKKVENAEFGLDALPLKPIESTYGFPSRLILPKGTPEGLPLQIFAFIAPFRKTSFSGLYRASTDFNSAIMSPGYPLDLDIEDTHLFALPNALVKDFIITHKGDSKVVNSGGAGATKKWQGGSSYDYSTQKRQEPFDYTAKKGQYGKKEDYSVEKDGLYKETQDTAGMAVTHIENINLLSSIGTGTTGNWQGGSSAYKRPDYSASRKEPFDYKSKKDQYRNKEDYAAKRDNFYKNKDAIDKNDNIESFSDIGEDKLINKADVNKDVNQDFYGVEKDLPTSTSVTKDDITDSDVDVREIHLLRQTGDEKPPLSEFDHLFPQFSDDDDIFDKIYEK